MADLAARLEVTKLRRELGADAEALSFLEQIPAGDLREIRTMISDAMFTHHEARFVHIAGLTKILPMSLIAKIASMAIGPMISAQIANVIEPKDGVKLARQLKPEFLADVSLHLDPAKVEPIIAGLPPATIVWVGRLLLARGEHPDPRTFRLGCGHRRVLGSCPRRAGQRRASGGALHRAHFVARRDTRPTTR